MTRPPGPQHLVFDADDTLWENNVHFERAVEAFLDWLDHPSLTRDEVRAVIDETELANAGSHGYGSAAFGRNLWDPMIAVNLNAVFEMSYEAGKVMSARGSGKIINIASLFSFLGGQQSPAYAATKAGLVGFTKAYCDELAGFGVQVNAIAPGYYATAITTATRANADADRRITEHIPAGRWGDPSDLMGATVFLASPASDYVNGHVLVVDGGYLVR